MENTQPQVLTVVSQNQVAPVNESNQILGMISQLVSQPDFKVEALEKMMQLQNQMEDRQAIKAFNNDFSAMMAEIPVIVKTGLNKFNGTQFTKLEDIVEITRPILAKHGFSITYKQNQEMLPNASTEPNSIFCLMTVICFLKHKNGHEESNEIQLPVATIKGQTAIQAMGMGSTYGRRYTLMQALNIAVAGSDNDGNVANFAQQASAGKKPIKDKNFLIALEKAKIGEIDLVRDLLDRYELTEEQKDILNGKFATVEGE